MPKSPAARRVAMAELHPQAECLTKGCPWDYPASGHTLEWAKKHATDRNHKTRLVYEKVALYCRPDYSDDNTRDDA